MCLLLVSQEIHFFHLLRDFWDKSKGVSKVFELTLFAEIVLWPGFEGLVASNSPEKSKGFFLGQLCNLWGIFFLDQRSIADPRKRRSLAFCMRSYQVGLNDWNLFQLIQAMTCFSPIVGGHLTFPKGHLTIPKKPTKTCHVYMSLSVLVFSSEVDLFWSQARKSQQVLHVKGAEF